MAVAQGYGKTATSGSVFAYDTGDTVNSYKGKPTTNRFSTEITDPTLDSLAIGNGAGSNPQLGSGGTCAVALFNGEKVLAINRGTSSGVYYENRVYWSIPLTTGNYYSWSAWVYSTVAGPTLQLEYYGGDYNWGVAQSYNTHTGTGWERLYAYANAVASSNTQTYCFIYINTNNTIYVKDFQLENQIYPTQFTTGTRSATQGLLPLVGNSTLDLSNVSFDSNAQMTFDGSDDRILTSENITLNGSQTFEVITTISGGPQSPAGIISNHDYANTSNFGLNHISSNRIGISIGYTDNTREYDSKYTTYAATVGTPFHLVMTFDQPSNTVKLYVNGALDSTFVLTKTVKFTNRPIVLGRWDYQYNYYYFNGKVPAAKVYTRALSAGEVRQNYLHYKTRFNLS